MSIYKITVGARKAESHDLFANGELIPNTLVLIRTGSSFLSTYVIQGDERISERYPAFNGGVLYVLTKDADRSEFIFKLIIRQAIYSDVFQLNFSARTNTTFYFKKNDIGLEGPYKVSPTVDETALEININKGRLYVPHERQTFQPVEVPLSNAS